MTVMLVLLLCSALFVFYKVAGRVNTLMALVISTMCFLPKVLYGGSEADLTRSGISGAEPRIMTYTVAIFLILVLGFISRAKTTGYLIVIPFIIFLCVNYLFVWDQTGEINAGMVHFFTAAAAWCGGLILALNVDKNGKTGQYFVSWVLGAVLLQLVISILQFAGFPLFPTNAATSELVGSRVNGSFGHPTTLGKVLLLVQMVCLPFTRSTLTASRRAAWVSILASFPMLILSGGRANFFSSVVMVLLWTLMLPRGKALGSKVAIPLVVATVGFASAGVWAARFEEDPEGSTRQHFNEVALALLPDHPVAGTGPNSYITAAGPTDLLTAQGWPVHNSALLAAVEIGVLGALLLFAPLFVAFSKSWKQRRVDSDAGDFSRAYVAATPGIALVALTGWGMMSDTLPLWLFLAGFCFQKQQAVPLSNVDTLSSISIAQGRRIGGSARTLGR